MQGDQLKNVQKIVTAGMKLMYSEQGRKTMLSGLAKPGPAPEKVAREVLGIMTLLFDGSKGTMPPDAIPAAVAILIAEVFDFLEEGGEKVGKDDKKKALMIAMQMLPKVMSAIRQQRQNLPQKGVAQQQQQRPMPPQQPQPAPQQGGLLQGV